MIMKSKQGKLLFYSVLFILILLIGGQLFLPHYVSRQVKETISQEVDDVQNLRVDVRAFPAWKFFYSRADRVNIRAEKMVINGLTLENMESHYRNIYLGEDYIAGDNTDLNLLIREEALNDYIKQHYSELENVRIFLTDEQVFVRGSISIMETEINLQLSGDFTIEDPETIVFRPENIQVEEVMIPRQLLENFISPEEMGFSFNLAQLNFPLAIEEISISSGEVWLRRGKFIEELN